MVSIENLARRHGSREVLHGVSLETRPGRVTGFVGPNGTGKSSTPRCLLSLDQANGGTALIDGRPYRELRDPLRAVGRYSTARVLTLRARPAVTWRGPPWPGRRSPRPPA